MLRESNITCLAGSVLVLSACVKSQDRTGKRIAQIPNRSWTNYPAPEPSSGMQNHVEVKQARWLVARLEWLPEQRIKEIITQ